VADRVRAVRAIARPRRRPRPVGGRAGPPAWRPRFHDGLGGMR
jgi:hypothetical protein